MKNLVDPDLRTLGIYFNSSNKKYDKNALTVHVVYIALESILELALSLFMPTFGMLMVLSFL